MFDIKAPEVQLRYFLKATQRKLKGREAYRGLPHRRTKQINFSVLDCLYKKPSSESGANSPISDPKIADWIKILVLNCTGIFYFMYIVLQFKTRRSHEQTR
jgi:hypothetical protein